jgi:hypothetical protein
LFIRRMGEYVSCRRHCFCLHHFHPSSPAFPSSFLHVIWLYCQPTDGLGQRGQGQVRKFAVRPPSLLPFITPPSTFFPIRHSPRSPHFRSPPSEAPFSTLIINTMGHKKTKWPWPQI